MNFKSKKWKISLVRWYHTVVLFIKEVSSPTTYQVILASIVQFLLIIVGILGVAIIGSVVFGIYSIKYTLNHKLPIYWHRVAVSLDQTGASFFGWDEDVTISERLGLEVVHGRANWWVKLLCGFLSFFDKDHCRKQAAKYYKERRESKDPFYTT